MYYKQHSDTTTECWLRNTQTIQSIYSHLFTWTQHNIRNYKPKIFLKKATQLTWLEVDKIMWDLRLSHSSWLRIKSSWIYYKDHSSQCFWWVCCPICKVQEEETGTSWNLNMDATSSFETLMTTYQSIRRHTYMDLNLLDQIPYENEKQNKMWTCKLLFHLKHFICKPCKYHLHWLERQW
jgi:hypothetical protein